MVYTITFNPSLDYVVQLNQFVESSVNRAAREYILPGGKGINVSTVLQNLGVETIALGFVAGFTGVQLESFLQEQGLRTDFVHLKEGLTRINIKLCHGNKEDTEINGQGPFVTEEDLASLLKRLETLTYEDLLVLSGSVPGGVNTSVYGEILQMCNSKSVKCVVDASGALLRNALEYRPFLVKPNIHELEDFFGCKISDLNQALNYAKQMKNLGAKNVLVSLGAEGAFLVAENDRIYQQRAPFGTVKNAVGAGDSMVAGFLTGYLKHPESLQYALDMGICAGSASAFSDQLAEKDDVLELFRQIKKD